MSTRRGQGEGSISQRASDSLWTARVDLGYVNGKRKRKQIYGKTRKGVAEKLKMLLREQQQGLPIATAKQTVAQFLSQWLTDAVHGVVRQRTYESYKQIVEKHIIPGLGRHDLSKLTAQHVSGLLKAKHGQGLSPSTVKYIRTVLRIALNQAVKWDVIPRNVVAAVPAPKVERHEVRAMTPAEARTFLAAVKGDRLEALYSVALAIGLRQGEALGLHWQDIDLDAGVLRVRLSLQRIGGKLQLVAPKTEHSKRTIPLPLPTIAALREHKIRQMEERLLLGSDWLDQGLVFPTPMGTPMDKGNLGKQFRALLANAGLPRMRFHDLRHCCASLLLAQNVPGKVVQEILGHSQISITLDLYSHVLPAAKNDAASLMGDLLTGNK
ncbi:MAG: site-specific integrase [Herpetosiphon sp.]